MDKNFNLFLGTCYRAGHCYHHYHQQQGRGTLNNGEPVLHSSIRSGAYFIPTLVIFLPLLTAPRTRAVSGQTGLTYTLHMFHVYSFIQEHSNKYYLLMAKNFVQFILQCFSLKVIFQDICKIFAGVYRMRTAEIGLLHFIELFTPRRLLLAAGC